MNVFIIRGSALDVWEILKGEMCKESHLQHKF